MLFIVVYMQKVIYTKEVLEWHVVNILRQHILKYNIGEMTPLKY